MRKWLLLCVFSILSAEEMTLDSDFAQYQGKNLNLSGHVVISHELGKLYADKVQGTLDGDNQLTHLKMNDAVQIAFKDGGSLSCDQAEMDQAAQLGEFRENVVYQDKEPFVVKGPYMKVKFANENGQPHIEQIEALEKVNIEYDSTISAESLHGLYTQDGVFVLDDHCTITNQTGDWIHADKVQFDLKAKTMQFTTPEGSLDQDVTFRAKALLWEDPKDLLTLSDQVILDQKGLGTLKTDKELRVKRKQVGPKKAISTIISEGKTVLTHLDPQGQEAHTITCNGTMCVDHENLVTTMNTPLAEDGLAVDGKQVFFEDRFGEIYANNVTLNYAEEENRFVPRKLTLEGQVYILCRYKIGSHQTEELLQYAIADKAEYNPDTKEMLLTAKNDQRVLFFDKVNNLQISAPALKIRRDQVTKKDTVQGIGDVRFNMIENEFEQLKKRFS